jgi:hypothetical protein
MNLRNHIRHHYRPLHRKSLAILAQMILRRHHPP